MKLVLISYLNRSGSTFLVNQLSKHPLICVCPEAEILMDLFLEFPKTKFLKTKTRTNRAKNILENNYKFSLWNYDITSLNIIDNNLTGIEIFISILKKHLELNSPNSNTIIFKGDGLIKYFEIINVITLKLKIETFWISIIRDPRAIFYSQKITISPFTKKPMCINPVLFNRNFKKFSKQISKNQNSTFFKIIKYEDLIQNFNQAIESIYTFLKIPYNIKILNNRSELQLFLNKEYKNIHQNIEILPQTDKINKWMENLEDIYKIYISDRLYNNYNIFGYKRIFLNIKFPIIQKIKFHLLYFFYFINKITRFYYLKTRIIIFFNLF